MTKQHVNAAKNVWGATTRQRLTHAGGTDRSLCVDSDSWRHPVMPRGHGESSRSNRFVKPNLQLADPTGCHIGHLTGAHPAFFPGKLKLGLPANQAIHEFQS